MTGEEIFAANSTHIDALSCGCPACSGLSADEASLDPAAGGTANGKAIWTPDQIAAYLNRTGGQFGTGANDLATRGGDPNVITFGFHENQQSLFDNGYVFRNPQTGRLNAFSEFFQFGAFTEAQRVATREAIKLWDDVIAVDFKETHANQGDINFGNLTNSPNTQAYSRIPTAGYANNFNGFYGTEKSIAGLAGDVWVSVSQSSNFQFGPNGYGMNTLTHEIGHSLGLSHPGNYNFGANFSATYRNGAEYAQDARNYSIMSYWNPRDMGSTSTGVATRDFNWSVMNIAYGATPMIHDIYAAQKMYGVEVNTRTGDTVYGFNSTADRAIFDFSKNLWPTLTIWDAGGIDTLDASGFGVRQVIDLTPGSLSSIGGITLQQAASLSFEQVNANRAAEGLGPVSRATYDANMAAFRSDPEWRGRLTDNVGIAYGADIENAKGGSGADLIYGNKLDNQLFGNAGDDLIFGRDGADSLFGGAGADTLDGGNGDDAMDGGAGDDQLRGGSGVDRMTGGAGDDTFLGDIGTSTVEVKHGSLAMDIIVDFDLDGDDRFDFTATDANTDVEGIQAFTFVGRAAGKGVGELSYKTYGSVHAAEQVLGIELDGLSDSTAARKVTIVFGNTDADADAEFAFVLLGANGVDADDFVL